MRPFSFEIELGKMLVGLKGRRGQEELEREAVVATGCCSVWRRQFWTEPEMKRLAGKIVHA